MKSRWKEYLLYGSLITIVGLFIILTYETYRANNMGFETKSYWDWMDLLIIPLFLAGGAFYLNSSEKEIERKATEDRADLEREIAKDRQQEIALQNYLDRMSDLLLEKKLRTTKETEVRDLAKTRTLSILRVLDTQRNDLIIQFLREAKLITDENSILNNAVMEGMSLQGLNLQRLYLQNTRLTIARLEGAILAWSYLDGAHLSGAHLEGATLYETHLNSAILYEANLNNARLESARLDNANLCKAHLRDAHLELANLKNAYLEGADLKGAFLMGANLEGTRLQDADLQGANLQSAKVTEAQLADAKSLKGATMPDGTKHV